MKAAAESASWRKKCPSSSIFWMLYSSLQFAQTSPTAYLWQRLPGASARSIMQRKLLPLLCFRYSWTHANMNARTHFQHYNIQKQLQKRWRRRCCWQPVNNWKSKQTRKIWCVIVFLAKEKKSTRKGAFGAFAFVFLLDSCSLSSRTPIIMTHCYCKLLLL